MPNVCLCSKHFTHISPSNPRDSPVCGVRVRACYFYPHCKDKVSEHIKFAETEVLRNYTYYVCDVLFSSPFYAVMVSSILFFSFKCTPRSELMTCKWVTIHGWIWKTLFRRVGMDPPHTHLGGGESLFLGSGNTNSLKWRKGADTTVTKGSKQRLSVIGPTDITHPLR